MKSLDYKCYSCGGTPCNNPGFCGITSKTLVEEMKKYQLEYMAARKKASMHTISFQYIDFTPTPSLSFGGTVFQAHKDYLWATLKFMNL